MPVFAHMWEHTACKCMICINAEWERMHMHIYAFVLLQINGCMCVQGEFTFEVCACMYMHVCASLGGCVCAWVCKPDTCIIYPRAFARTCMDANLWVCVVMGRGILSMCVS